MRGFNIKGRSLLSLYDVTDSEMLGLLDIAARLKRRKKKGIRGNLLERKHIALVFEKASTRTRCAATVAAADEGGTAEYLAADSIHFGKKESVADTARVLGRMFDGIMFRGYAQATAEALARNAGVPVWNGLTDDEHPTQALADLMTVRERFVRIKGLRLAYVGDGRNNVATSLMQACAKAGVDFVNVTPPELTPCDAVVRRAMKAAHANGATVRLAHDPHAGVKGANVVCTDVWTSMGEEKKFRERIRLLRPYQVNAALMRATGNMESGRVIFLHCLPAFHGSDTEVTRDIGALEVTDEVFSAPYSKVFDEAENRVHTIKALFVASLGGRFG
jgi:ornithine carbamoyltransferase